MKSQQNAQIHGASCHLGRHMRKQRGIVLVLSLLILLMLTILGVTAFGNTLLEGHMALNYQSSTVAFQAAESRIQQTINASKNFTGTGAPNPILQALSSQPASYTVTPSTALALDPFSAGSAAAFNTETSTKFIQQRPCSGSTIGLTTCYQFEVTSIAGIGAEGATEAHIQGIERMAPNPN